MGIKMTNKEAAKALRAAATTLESLPEGDPIAETLKEAAVMATGNVAAKAVGGFVTGLMRRALSTGSDDVCGKKSHATGPRRCILKKGHDGDCVMGL